ncbi:39S ribosomal protein L28 [Blattella germanica]|nr:39S ribosomal protein L28 [Blattella germanica]
MDTTKAYRHVNKLLKFKKPDVFDQGVAARLPDAYKKFWFEWRRQERKPVHYIPEEGKWKRHPETGIVTPVQNIPIPLQFPNESNEGLWGGEGIVKGFQKRHALRRRTPACDLQSELALKLKQKMLLALFEKNLYPEDEAKREDVYNTYKHYVTGYTKEEIEWYGLNFYEAIKKQMNLERQQRTRVPLKQIYRAELIEKLKAAGIEGVKAVMDEHEALAPQQKSTWLSKMNPFSSRK